MNFLIHTVLSMGDKAKGLKAAIYACVSNLHSDEEICNAEFNRCATCAVQREMEVGRGFIDIHPQGTLSLGHPNFVKAVDEIEAGRANALILITQKGIDEDVDTLMQINERVVIAGGTLFFDHYLSFKEPNGNSTNEVNVFINAISPRTPKEFEDAQSEMLVNLFMHIMDARKVHPEAFSSESNSEGTDSSDMTLEEVTHKPRKAKRKRPSRAEEEAKSISIAEKKKMPIIPSSNVVFY